MSKFLDRLRYFKQLGEPFSGQHGQTLNTNRDWEDGYRSRWQHDAPRHLHATAVLPSCKAGAPDRGAFVGAQQRGGYTRGVDRKQGGQQDQTTTAHDGVYKPSQSRSEGDEKEFHAGDCGLKEGVS